MFDTAKTHAKLLPSDLAKLLGVNRCTVSFWFNDRAKPHVQLQEKVQKVLDAVAMAVEANDLPVPHGVNRRERAHYIRSTIVKHLTAKLSKEKHAA